MALSALLRIPFLQTSLRGLEELFFPPRCQVCGRALCRNEVHICTPCLGEMPFLPSASTSLPALLEKYRGEGCPEQLFVLFYYDRYDLYKNLLYHIKYDAKRSLAFTLGTLLGKNIAEFCSADYIIPIPLHPKRERARGYNQALEIARGVARELGIEMLDDVIVRIHHSESQTGKGTFERRNNVAGVFRLLEPERIRGRHILLLDDVVTTGATMASCMETLSAAGDVQFSLACLARI